MNDKTTLLLKRFALAASAHHRALEEMDDVRADTQARMLSALHDALRREGPAGGDELLTLLDSTAPEVAGMAAVYLLHLHPERCLAVLRSISSVPGLLGFRAGVVVERWEAGEWTPPA